MGEYLLGIDIGTSACKIAVFAKDGTVKATGTGDYQVYYPHPGWAEQNPEEWWEAVCDAIPKVLAKGNISPEEIKGIGIDGQSWSAIAVDKDGNVLTNTPIWMDTRATDICEEFNEKIGKDKIFELCGNSLQPSYTTAKIIWYQRNLPEVYAKTYPSIQQLHCIQTDRCDDTGPFSGIWSSLLRYENRNLEGRDVSGIWIFF